MRRSLLTALVTLACLLGMAASASAHAVLESSAPARGAELKVAPDRVDFRFNEPVEASLGAVRVFNTDGEEVQSDGPERPGASTEAIGVELPADLPDGLYTATYRVVSADAHPISGGITFTVGKPGKDQSAFVQSRSISDLLAENETGTVTEVGFWFVRLIGYLAIALAVGGIVWMLFVLGREPSVPAGSDREVAARFQRLMLPVAATGLLVSLLAIIFQGAVGAGTSFQDAFGSGIPRQVIDTRYGTMMLVRAEAWVVILGLVIWAGGQFRRPGAVSFIGLLAATVLVVTPSLAGHASTRDPGWLLIPSDIVHVAAMAVWAGGLAAMLWILPAATRQLKDPTIRTSLLTGTATRFSGIALVSVALIGVSGAVQAIIDVGSVGDLLSTQFGRAVLIKIVLFALLVGLGAANRMRIIPALVRRQERAESPGGPGNRLRQLLRVEVVTVVAVLGVTAALVSYPPPDAITSGPASGSVQAGPNRLDYTVDPAKVGRNEVHLYVFDDQSGAPVPVISVDVSFSLPDREIAPIEADVRRAGGGHFIVPSAMLGVKGDWQATVAMRLSRFDEPTATFKVEIE
ncbi:MAG TPA: copper resistance protein CopC [Solirubrobacterales bacterium]|nr:copper resistance protein CopC [Solirubrobacterales bacterium]